MTLVLTMLVLYRKEGCEMGPKKDQFSHTDKNLKDWNKSQYGDRDSENIDAAHHQARNDYQDSGSPFGSLDRDRSSKDDTNAK